MQRTRYLTRPVVSVAIALLVALSFLLAPARSTTRPVERVPAGIAFTGYVVDTANVLDEAARYRLTQRLGRFQRETKHQMAIVSVRSLGGVDLKTFSIRLGKRWGVGRRGYNDGVLIVLAPGSGVRIATGMGLERALPDAFCQDVLDRLMMPAMREGRIAEGVEAGVAAIIAKLKPG